MLIRSLPLLYRGFKAKIRKRTWTHAEMDSKNSFLFSAAHKNSDWNDFAQNSRPHDLAVYVLSNVKLVAGTKTKFQREGMVDTYTVGKMEAISSSLAVVTEGHIQ